MTELPIGEIRKLIEGIREDNSRKWLLGFVSLLVFTLTLYFAAAGYLLETNIVSTKLVQDPIRLIEKVTAFSSFAHILIVILIIAILFLVSIFFLWIKDIYMRNKGYQWNSSDKLNDWDFQGAVIVEKVQGENIIKIKSSLLGMIIKNRSWRNYIMTFKFFIPKEISYGQKPKVNQLERGFGIIYRASNLDQYYMIKIDADGLRPHINNNQLWEDLGPTVTSEKPLEKWLDKWISVKIELNNNVLFATVDRITFNMPLPKYSLVRRKFPIKHDEEASSELTPFLPLTYHGSGSIGFRSAPFEEVHIKDLKINSENFFSRILYEIKKIWIDN